MANDNITAITDQLEALELSQTKELEDLLDKHSIAKRLLLRKLRLSTSTPPKSSSTATSVPRVLSLSKKPLLPGQIVVIRSKSSIGRKGDLAEVLSVDPGRIDIYIPRLDERTWRAAHNLAHRS